MLKNIAVDGCELELSVGTGDITIIGGQTTDNIKCDGKAAYTSLAFMVSNFTGGDITVAKSGSGGGSIDASATKVKIMNCPAFLEGDKTNVPIVITGQKPSGTSTVVATCNVTVSIKKAGQDKVKGE